MSSGFASFFDKIKQKSPNVKRKVVKEELKIEGEEKDLGEEILSPSSDLQSHFNESPSFSSGVLKLMEAEDDTENTPVCSNSLPLSEEEEETLTPKEEQKPFPKTIIPTLPSMEVIQPSTSTTISFPGSEGDLGKSAFSSSARLKRRSRLSKCFSEVLEDPNALNYFIQFMECRNVGSLIRFYLAAESFRVSASAVFRPDSHKARSVHNNEEQTLILNGNGDGSDGSSNSKDSGVVPDSSSTPSSAPSQTLPPSFPGNRTSSKAQSSVISTGLREMTERDAVSLFAKYISKDAPSSISVTEDIRNSVINGICGENGCVDANCFLPAQNFVRKVIEGRYFPDFIGSIHFMKHQVDVLTSGFVTLPDIVFNETALCYFTEFMEMEKSRKIVEFWLAADNFKQDLQRRKGIYDGIEAQNDAMVLYDKYFSLQATESLDLGEKIRLEVENNICREEGPLPDCFERPWFLVFHQMEKEFLPKFLNSKLFSKYISELRHTIKNTLELPDPNKPRARKGSTTGSDLSSGDISVGSSSSLGALGTRIKNTLLAQESPQAQARRRQLSQVSSDQISLDSTSYGHQDLFERPSSKLALGKVDALGQYVREYDDSSFPISKKNLKEKMKDLVNKEKKEEEELALKVAQLIISDVTQMTQNNPHHSHNNSALSSSNFGKSQKMVLTCSLCVIDDV